MDPKRSFSVQAFIFTLMVGLAAATTFISDSVFESQRSTGRNLLQTKKTCPVSFEFMNYTIITSQCKGPQYPAKLCFKAFKDFTCPYTEQINDTTNDCTSIMFSYINLRGKYPPGLFAAECKEGKEGLACPANSPQASQNGYANAAHITRSDSSNDSPLSACSRVPFLSRIGSRNFLAAAMQQSFEGGIIQCFKVDVKWVGFFGLCIVFLY